jgi:biopolymer transport protein ExbD
MLQPLQKVTIAGQERELLYTLSLYKILQDRKQQVVIDKEATWADVTSALLRMIYAAYLNAIEVRQIDESEVAAFLAECSAKDAEMFVALYADEDIPYSEVVKVLNIANENKYKMVLATRPPKSN